VVLSVSSNNVDPFELLAGATGYLLKGTSAARLPAALCAVLAGEAAVPRAILQRLIKVTVRRQVWALHKLDVANPSGALQLRSDGSATGWPEASSG
jgi:DNA-binding NarL/FixJ family response regulator